MCKAIMWWLQLILIMTYGPQAGPCLLWHIGCCTPLRPSLCTYLILGVWDDFDTRFPSGRTKSKLFPTYWVVGWSVVVSPKLNTVWIRLFDLCSYLELLSKWQSKGKGIRFIVLYPPKRSHDLPPLAGTAHTETVSIPQGIFQSNWQHIAHML